MRNASVHTYQQLISKYRIRRNEYNKKVRSKMRVWRNAIKRIRKREEKIKALVVATNKYFKIDISANKYHTGYVSFARYCYYKYGLEHKVTTGNFLSGAIGTSSDEAAAKRRKLARQFKADVTKRDDYHKYKDAMESILL